MNYLDKKIRGFHLDLYGHVNNARYLEFLEEARWDLLEQHFDLHKLWAKGYQFIITNIDIHFKQSLKLAEIIRIHCQVKEVGMASFTLRQTINSQTASRLAAYADVKIVILNSNTKKPVKLSGDLLDNIHSLPHMQIKSETK